MLDRNKSGQFCTLWKGFNIIFLEAQIYVCNKVVHKFLFSEENKMRL